MKHEWRKAPDLKNKKRPDYCENCGVDRSAETERTRCRPTTIL